MYSLISSKSLVAPARGLHGVALCAPAWRVLVGSALSSGACRWRLRSSSRSFTNAVVVVGFKSHNAAIIFAAAWSAWVGVACAVRKFNNIFGVSVPVAAPPASAAAHTPPPQQLPATQWVH